MQAAALMPGEYDWRFGTLQRALGPAGADWQLQSCRSIDSTNSELLRRIRTGLDRPSLLVAQHQTAGRGRLGRAWQTAGSEPAAADLPALTFSLALQIQQPDWSGLSLVTGLAVLRALRALAKDAAPGLGLKWPNDLWWHGGKLAGILIESAGALGDTGMAGRFAVIGIGINLDMPPFPAVPVAPADGAALHAAVPPAALRANLQVRDGVSANAVTVLHAVLPQLMADLGRFATLGFAPYQAEFAAVDLLAGQDLWLSDGRNGRGLGVDECGALRVCVEGMETRVFSGEVSVRPASMARRQALMATQQPTQQPVGPLGQGA